MPDYEYCILKSENEIFQYEKALYHSFKFKYPEYVAEMYDEIEADRLRSKSIPYSSQVIYAIKNNDELISCSAVCVNPKQKFEIELMGFKFEKTDKHCEGINFFSIKKFANQKISGMKIYSGFRKFIFADLKKRGFNFLLSSCDEKTKNFYLTSGAKLIDKLTIFNQTEYLLKYDL